MHPQWLLGQRSPPKNIEQASGTVLDIGAADKWIAKHLSAGVQYVSLDYPATGHEMYAARPDVFSDAARLPFCDAAFDGLICLEVLEHVADPARVMTEIARVLKPGGRAWISMPFLYPLHDAPFDFQRFTEYGLRRDVQRAGLKVVALEKRGHAIRTAGVLGCLAIAGALYGRRAVVAVSLLPLATLMVLAINVMAFVLSLLWPDWEDFSSGYELELGKPGS